MKSNGPAARLWEELFRKGIATKTEVRSEGMFGPFELIEYDIAEEYWPNFLLVEGPDAPSSFGFDPIETQDAYICLGEGKIDSVLNFTIPGDGASSVETEVTYRYFVQSTSGAEEIKSYLSSDFETGGEYRRGLVLTNNGWEVRTTTAPKVRVSLQSQHGRAKRQMDRIEEYAEVARATGCLFSRDRRSFTFKTQEGGFNGLRLPRNQSVEEFQDRLSDVCESSNF